MPLPARAVGQHLHLLAFGPESRNQPTHQIFNSPHIGRKTLGQDQDQSG